jgi:hypothetical protein
VRVYGEVLYSLIYFFLIRDFDLSFFRVVMPPIHHSTGPVQGTIENRVGHSDAPKTTTAIIQKNTEVL